MPTSHFIACCDSAAGSLKQRNRLLGQSNPIVAILDDFRMGPLADADQLVALQRTAWWKTIWRAQWWFDSDEYETDLLEHQAECQSCLLSVLASPEPVVVWMGNNAHDKLVLAMIASLTPPQTALSVVDITGQVSWQYEGQYAVAICPPEALLQLVPRPLTDGEHIALREQWTYWKGHGQGWRETGANGQVVEYPLDYLDGLLVAKLAELGPQSAGLLVGKIIGEYPSMVPSNFLFWRLDILRQAGQVVFTPQTGPKPQAPKVALT
ncbi:DUF1835 domain-containing protein [Burkholderia pyrrocinia]|uniref:DUF1835 domain-containing protein n=1 Tax=Burkholderia pyrrocinia TaxID=60550 RepID=UPI001588A7F7|nr:DUF1835 domain-containing protein [Burkholderia pyrrocinia]